MKTELTRHGTWLATGNYAGVRYIASGNTRIAAMADGMRAIENIALSKATSTTNTTPLFIGRRSANEARDPESTGYCA